MNRPLIALLTDFGLADAYVGVMKGVMKSICPDAEFIDISHGVRPQAIEEAAFLLSTSHDHFPDHTVLLCVVDPGVGSDRAALAMTDGRHRFVAPDNGLLSLVWRRSEHPVAHMIVNPKYRLAEVSATFHGRDIFAPAAAHLGAGVPLAELGPRVPDIEQIAFAGPRREGAGLLRAAVLHIDHFGNIITNVRRPDLRGVEPESITLELGAQVIEGLRTTYSSVGVGEPIAHWGSSEHLEIAVRRQAASEHFGLGVGDPVTIRWSAKAEG